MKTAKEEVRQLDALPDNATFEDIQYNIYVRQKTSKGLTAVREGRVLSQTEAEARMAR